MNTLLDQFFELMKKLRNMILWSLSLSTLFYLFLNSVTSKIPPNVDHLASSAIMLISLFFCFYNLIINNKQWHNKIFNIGIAIFLVSIFANIFLYDRFIYTIPTNSERIILGCGWGDNTKLILDDFFISEHDDCPGNFKILLERAEYESNQIWTTTSIKNIKIIIHIIWFLIPISLGMFLSTFIIKLFYTKPKRLK